jgi:hypothetical protein
MPLGANSGSFGRRLLPDAGYGLGSSRLASGTYLAVAANPIPLVQILNGLNMGKFHYLFMVVVLPY